MKKTTLKNSWIRRKTQNENKVLKAVSSLWFDYTAKTTLACVHYIGDRKRHFIERIFWAIVFMVSMYFCFVMIIESYYKWKAVPIITSFDESPISIFDIPFPAVTVCPEIKSNITEFDWYEKLQQLEHNPENVSDVDQGRIAALMSVCKRDWNPNIKWNTSTQPDQYAFVLRKLALNRSLALTSCATQGYLHECDKIFTEVITNLGICYSYNLNNATDIFRKEVADELKFNSVKIKNGTKFKLHKNLLVLGSKLSFRHQYSTKEFEHACTSLTPGVAVKIHSSDEIPNFFHDVFTLQSNGYSERTTFELRPKMLKISEGLAQVAPELRNCYFENERFLRFFKKYNQNNCELECWTNVTLKLCGCVKFSMLRDNKTKICGTADGKCYDEAREFMISNEALTKNDKSLDQCVCLPSCNSISYDVKVANRNYKGLNLRDIEFGPFRSYFVDAAFEFQQPSFTGSTRSELFNFTEMLGNCGGLLGLFIGFSFLSLVELVYYVTLRLSCNLKRSPVENNDSKQNKKTSSIFMKVVHEYTENSTLHGINYIGDHTRHWIERLFWVILFCTSIIVCAPSIWDSFENWQTTSIVTMADIQENLITDIPFPAVTICPMIKTNYTEFNWWYELSCLDNPPRQTSNLNQGRIAALLQVCDRKKWGEKKIWNTTYKPKHYISLLKSINLKRQKTLLQCSFQGVEYPCDNRFLTETITNKGICYTFNHLDSSEIYRDIVTSELKYKKPISDIKFHKLTPGSGLNVIYRTLVKEYEFLCGNGKMEILLHSPDEIPHIQFKYTELQLEEMAQIIIKPTLTKISKGMEKLPPKIRGCYLKDEKYLRFFKVYTQLNCEHECWTNFTLRHCKCVKFTMPRDRKTKMCGIPEELCFKKAYILMVKTEDNSTESRCNCLPTCTSIKYETVVNHKLLSLDLIDRKFRKADEDRIYLRVEYDQPTFTSFTRFVLFDTTDLIANCGGLLGLYTGFSFLSLIELLYFLTIRVCCNLKKNLKVKNDAKLDTSPQTIDKQKAHEYLF